MTLLTVSVLLALVAAGWVIGPVVAHRFALLGDTAPGGVLDAEARKGVALASLRDVEYDYAAGKLDTADYQALKAQLSREAVDAIHVADQARANLDLGASTSDAHACGFTNPAGSRFCGGCGERLH